MWPEWHVYKPCCVTWGMHTKSKLFCFVTCVLYTKLKINCCVNCGMYTKLKINCCVTCVMYVYIFQIQLLCYLWHVYKIKEAIVVWPVACIQNLNRRGEYGYFRNAVEEENVVTSSVNENPRTKPPFYGRLLNRYLKTTF